MASVVPTALLALVALSALLPPTHAGAYAEVALRRPPAPTPSFAQQVRAHLPDLEWKAHECAAANDTQAASLRLTVVVFASGEWSATLGSARSLQAPGERGSTPLARCLIGPLASALGDRLRMPAGRPRGARVSQRYRLPVAASASQARAIARAAERHTEAFAACIADRSLSPRVDYLLQPNGQLAVVNVDGVAEAGFSDSLMCLRREAANIRGLPTYVRYSGSLTIPRAPSSPR